MIIPILILCAVLLLIIGLGLGAMLKNRQQQLGTLTQPRISTDNSMVPAEKLFSERWGLVGQPDYLIRDGELIIPVEVKTSATPTAPYFNHIMQVVAYCVLVTEKYQVRPPHGVIKYSDREFKVPFTEKYEEMLGNIMRVMRAYKQGSRAFNPSDNKKWLCRECIVKVSDKL
ncbi:MAG TPA: Dna2/Cas4 domain-containing protein [Vitreimonas sp.]|nr:Dna2/Cas4 domain-containing protein [Vitreimonas sp.]